MDKKLVGLSESTEQKQNIAKLYVQNNEIVAYAVIGNLVDSIEHEFKSVEELEDFEENFKPHKFLYVDGIITDNPAYEDMLQKKLQQNQIATEIAFLKSQLAETDYKIIKCHEYSLVGIELPYNTQDLHEKREQIREQIRQKEILI